MSLRIAQRLERPGGFLLDVDLELPESGVSVLFGRSGSGKSTLLRCTAGLEPAAQGRVRVGEALWQYDASGFFQPPQRRRAGMVFQHGALFEHLDVRGNLEFGWRRLEPGRRRTQPDEVIALLRLEPLLRRRTPSLSGGERQRVALGRALLGSPDLLLLDEPLASLDREARRQILPYLEDLPRRFALPILYVTHYMNEAARLADHLVLIEAGQVVRSGALTVVMTDPDSPLTREAEAGVVLRARVAAHDVEDHLARLDCDGGNLLIPDLRPPVGREVRVRIRARDVSLALDPPSETSILNVLPAEVIDVREQEAGRVLVRLQLGEDLLLAQVTRRSAAALALSPGRRVFAQVKSVALL